MKAHINSPLPSVKGDGIPILACHHHFFKTMITNFHVNFHSSWTPWQGHGLPILLNLTNLGKDFQTARTAPYINIINASLSCTNGVWVTKCMSPVLTVLLPKMQLWWSQIEEARSVCFFLDLMLFYIVECGFEQMQGLIPEWLCFFSTKGKKTNRLVVQEQQNVPGCLTRKVIALEMLVWVSQILHFIFLLWFSFFSLVLLLFCSLVLKRF